MIIDGICYSRSSSWNNILRPVQAKWVLDSFYAVAFLKSVQVLFPSITAEFTSEVFWDGRSDTPAPAFRKV